MHAKNSIVYMCLSTFVHCLFPFFCKFHIQAQAPSVIGSESHADQTRSFKLYMVNAFHFSIFILDAIYDFSLCNSSWEVTFSCGEFRKSTSPTVSRTCVKLVMDQCNHHSVAILISYSFEETF